MIQSPQIQYMPAQQVMQPQYQPATTYTPIQYSQNQTPGVFYNYPTASTYMPAQSYGTDKSQFNGVNIEIINPQGQGLSPQNAMQMPAQYIPVQQPVMIPQYPAQYPAQFPASQAVVQAPTYAPAQQVPVAPQVMPQPAPAIIPQQIPQNSVPQAVPEPQVNAQTPVIEQPAETPVSNINPESFAGKLKTNDLEQQKNAIEEVAEIVKNNETDGPVLLDTQIFDALVDIINKDTSALEGPSPEVLALRQKPQDQLTEEEKTKASTPSPLEKAEINKQYSLYTISYMQERLNNELEKRNNKALELKDLPCIETIIDTVKSNPNPMLRVGAIAALAHIARPEYKADLNTIFELAKSDEDSMVKDSAQKAIDTINAK